MDYLCEVLCWNTVKDTPNLANIITRKRPFCRQCRMICFTRSLIKQLYHFATDFDRVLLQLVGTDIESSEFKYRVSYRHPTFMIKTSELLMNSCEKFYLLFVRIQCATACSLEKVNFKLFKLPYVKN